MSATAFIVSGALSPSLAGSSAAQLLSPAGLAQIASRHGLSQDSTGTPAGPLANPAVQAQIKLSKANFRGLSGRGKLVVQGALGLGAAVWIM